MSLWLKKMGSHYTELSPQDKGKILAYMENFNATQIAKKMGRDPTTIRRFINKYKKTGSIENLPRSGRPPALNIIEKNALVNEVKKNRRAPLHEVVNTLGLNCGLTTARTTLYEAGICSRVAAKKPFISERHAAARRKSVPARRDIGLRRLRRQRYGLEIIPSSPLLFDGNYL